MITSEAGIHTVTVNHNTSKYMELMLRSLAATHEDLSGMVLEVLDNASEDDTTDLMACLSELDISLTQSGFSTDNPHNSHGEVLSSFILQHPEAKYYLLLDADVFFTQANTIWTMLQELQASPDAFAVAARMEWIEESTSESEGMAFYTERLHPACALVRNTETFRRVVANVGMSCIKYLHANEEVFWDTCKLMTAAMRTHGLMHIISSMQVVHFFGVSYDPEQAALSAGRRDQLLAEILAR